MYLQSKVFNEHEVQSHVSRWYNGQRCRFELKCEPGVFQFHSEKFQEMEQYPIKNNLLLVRKEHFFSKCKSLAALEVKKDREDNTN